MTEQTTAPKVADRNTERIDHLLHPRTPAEQLRAILAGGEHADDGRIAALAKDVLAERDRLAGALAAVRMTATESATDDASILRRAILDQTTAGGAS